MHGAAVYVAGETAAGVRMGPCSDPVRYEPTSHSQKVPDTTAARAGGHPPGSSAMT